MNFRNFAHKSNFVFVTNLFGEESTYSIQSANLPGISLQSIDSSHRGMNLSFQGDTLDFSELNIEMILFEDFSNWIEVVDTFNKMRELEDNEMNIEERRSTLFLQDENQDNILKIDFFNSKLLSVSDIEFSTSDDTDEEITFSLSIKYDYYTVEKL